MAPAVGFGGSLPVFNAIQTQFTWVIKQTLAILGRTFSLRFAGNFAGSETVEQGRQKRVRMESMRTRPL